jgi:hypothetical protein
MFFVVLVVPAQELYNEISRLVISLIFACSSGALLKKGARQVRLATRMTEEFINATSDELIGAAERASSVQPSRRIQAGVQHFAGDVRRACLRNYFKIVGWPPMEPHALLSALLGSKHTAFLSRVIALKSLRHRARRRIHLREAVAGSDTAIKVK